MSAIHAATTRFLSELSDTALSAASSSQSRASTRAELSRLAHAEIHRRATGGELPAVDPIQRLPPLWLYALVTEDELTYRRRA